MEFVVWFRVVAADTSRTYRVSQSGFGSHVCAVALPTGGVQSFAQPAKLNSNAAGVPIHLKCASPVWSALIGNG